MSALVRCITSCSRSCAARKRCSTTRPLDAGRGPCLHSADGDRTEVPEGRGIQVCVLGELYTPLKCSSSMLLLHTSNGTCGTAFDNNLTATILAWWTTLYCRVYLTIMCIVREAQHALSDALSSLFASSAFETHHVWTCVVVVCSKQLSSPQSAVIHSKTKTFHGVDLSAADERPRRQRSSRRRWHGRRS